MVKFPNIKQTGLVDCGPTCLSIVSKHYGVMHSISYLRNLTDFGRDGSSLLGISRAAEAVGYKTIGGRTDLQGLYENSHFPCIIHFKDNHFSVVYRIKKNRSGYKVFLSDPYYGLITHTDEDFEKKWLNESTKTGTVLLIEPTEEFYTGENHNTSNFGFKNILNYILRFKWLIFQLFLGFLFSSVVQLVLPFLTKSLVDKGILTSNHQFIIIVLLGQGMLTAGRTLVELVQSWVFLHISSRVSVNILSDFVIKLLKLPLSFFANRSIGDVLQRINDNARIEAFLTGTSLQMIFAIFNLLVFSAIVISYDAQIFMILVFGNVLYVLWILLFLKSRKKIDTENFDLVAKHNSSLIQLISGIQEIKLSNTESSRRWDWESMQVQLIKQRVKSLRLNQVQKVGSVLINEGKNLFILYLTSNLVVSGNLTLGTMMAMQYIIGMLAGPIGQFIGFIQSWQDAQISLDRLNEVHSEENEDDNYGIEIDQIEAHEDIVFTNVSFTYQDRILEQTINDITLTIPRNKVTAIVGSSGSGKTTLIKLLLKIHKPQKGRITVGNHSLEDISNRSWRDHCGTVMQDGFIFSESLSENIALKPISDIRTHDLHSAIKIACLEEFVSNLPQRHKTKIGSEGSGLSQGQKQRILIARAVYKKPTIFLFDEATNALDSVTESSIVKNLTHFFNNRTVIIIAHRLNTVIAADQIVVMDAGKVLEVGSHTELLGRQGAYYNLFRKQLEQAAV